MLVQCDSFVSILDLHSGDIIGCTAYKATNFAKCCIVNFGQCMYPLILVPHEKNVICVYDHRDNTMLTECMFNYVKYSYFMQTHFLKINA